MSDEPKKPGLWSRYKNPFIAWSAILGGLTAYDVTRAVQHHDTLSRAAGALIDAHPAVGYGLGAGLGYLWYHLAVQSKPKK